MAEEFSTVAFLRFVCFPGYRPSIARRPIEQVAHVREDLGPDCPDHLRSLEIGKPGGSAAEGLRAPVGERRDAVPEQCAVNEVPCLRGRCPCGAAPPSSR